MFPQETVNYPRTSTAHPYPGIRDFGKIHKFGPLPAFEPSSVPVSFFDAPTKELSYNQDASFLAGCVFLGGIVPEETGAAATAHDKAKLILDLLAQRQAMSLVEIMSVVDIPDNEIQAVVGELEKNNLVKVSQGDTLDRIVTIRDEGLRAAG
jgi:hypothetical protein